jgi:hypothetical protein
MSKKNDTRPGPDPKRGRNPGYAEQQPRDKGDALEPAEPKSRNPLEEGGVERDTDRQP